MFSLVRINDEKLKTGPDDLDVEVETVEKDLKKDLKSEMVGWRTNNLADSRFLGLCAKICQHHGAFI